MENCILETYIILFTNATPIDSIKIKKIKVKFNPVEKKRPLGVRVTPWDTTQHPRQRREELASGSSTKGDLGLFSRSQAAN